MPPHRSTLARLAAATALLAAIATFSQACGDSATFATQGCLPKDMDGTCPSQDDAKGKLPNLEDCSGVEAVTAGPTITQDAVPCCYHYTLSGCRSN